MGVCMCVCACVCIIHTFVRKLIYTNTNEKNIYVHVCMHAYIHAYIRTYLHIYMLAYIYLTDWWHHTSGYDHHGVSRSGICTGLGGNHCATHRD